MASRPAYLSLDRWSADDDGFVSLSSLLSSSVEVPLRIGRSIQLPNTTVVRVMASRLRSGEERLILRMLLWLLPRVCQQSYEGRPGVVVDSGANEGTWTLLAAAHGCRAVAVEPQHECVRMLRAAASASEVSLATEPRGTTFAEPHPLVLVLGV